MRIIGGEWRSRWLTVAHVPGLRPSADAQRETIFNWLQSDIEGARVLDLFAGTGAFGFEAASRGARAVTLVERDPRASRQLAASKAALDAQQVTVLTLDVRRFLQADQRQPSQVSGTEPGTADGQPPHCQPLSNSGPDGRPPPEFEPATRAEPQGFDIVFLDPPFNRGLVPETLALLRKKSWLRRRSSLVYVEQERGAPPPDSGSWDIIRRRDCGEATGWLLQPTQERSDGGDGGFEESPDGDAP